MAMGKAVALRNLALNIKLVPLLRHIDIMFFTASPTHCQPPPNFLYTTDFDVDMGSYR